MLKIIIKISLVILFALLLSVGLDYLYRKAYSMKYQLPQNILILPEITQKYDLVALGNSHSQTGLTFKDYKVKSISVASVAQSFEYDYAMLQMHSQQIKKNAVIIINISPISFSQNKPGKDDDVNMNYYDGRLSPFLIPHLKISDYLQIQIFPFVRAGYLWRQSHAQYTEQLAINSYVANWVTPSPSPEPIQIQLAVVHPVAATRSSIPTFKVSEIKAELNEPPATSDARFDQSVQFMTNKWYNSGGFGTQSFDTNRKDLEDIIAYCLKHNWRPVLITIPISQALLNGLEPGYLQHFVYDNLAKANLRGATYFNFAQDLQITQDKYLFSNSDHLNDKGAAIFSYLLLRKLIENGYLPKTADGYDYSTPAK